MRIEGLRGLTRGERQATVDSIAAVQLPNGCIPWVPDGVADPWNMVECAMALAAGGRRSDAERAYEWLAARQRPDGSWPAYWKGSAVHDATVDANACAYIAVGALHHYRLTRDAGFLGCIWPVVEGAIGVAVGLQAPGGEIRWARDAEGRPWSTGLVTSSSCIHLSLRCGVAVARLCGHERPEWEAAAVRLAHALRTRPHAFDDKDRWSMDWYYPVLGGVVTGDEANARIDARWDEFVVAGLGVRCVSDQPWVTAAETCELVMALESIGRHAEAARLFEWVQWLRDDDGAYWTGATFPEGVHFPEERSTWTAAAVVLAYDALCAEHPAAGVFRTGKPAHRGR